MVSIALIIYLHLAEPLVTSFEKWLETFNECVNLMALYSLMCFTDFVPLPEDRDMVGDYFIALIIVSVSVHMLIICVSLVK